MANMEEERAAWDSYAAGALAYLAGAQQAAATRAAARPQMTGFSGVPDAEAIAQKAAEIASALLIERQRAFQ